MPAGHTAQLDAVALNWYVPMAQLEQALALPAAYVPDAQLPQTTDVVAPTVADAVPALQLAQLAEPVFAWNVPE